MAKHRAEPSDWTRHVEAKREREINNMHRLYAVRLVPPGPGAHRAEEQDAA